MPTAPLRIAVAGVGRIGQMHARIIAKQIPNARLVAVYDIVAQAAEAAAAELQVVAAASFEELANSPDVDAIAICTSTTTHTELIAVAAAAGKAIFCEKPISLSLTKVDSAITAVSTAGVPFMVGFNRRFDPGHEAVRNAVLAGELGTILSARLTSRDPAPPPIEYIRSSGGIWVDMMIHDFDMANYLTDSPVIQIYAQGSCRIDPAIGAAGDFDTAIAVLTHENGVISTIDVSRQAPYGYDQRVEVLGSKGMAISDNERLHNAQIYLSDSTTQAVFPHFFIERYATAYRRQWEAFTNYVLDGGASPVSARAGREPVALAIAAARSAELGQPVRLDEIG